MIITRSPKAYLDTSSGFFRLIGAFFDIGGSMPPMSNEKQEKFPGINEKHPKVYEIHREVFFIYNAKHLKS